MKFINTGRIMKDISNYLNADPNFWNFLSLYIRGDGTWMSLGLENKIIGILDICDRHRNNTPGVTIETFDGLLYEGPMFRGCAMPQPYTADEMGSTGRIASWSRDPYIAQYFAQTKSLPRHGRLSCNYHYMLIQSGIALSLEGFAKHFEPPEECENARWHNINFSREHELFCEYQQGFIMTSLDIS